MLYNYREDVINRQMIKLIKEGKQQKKSIFIICYDKKNLRIKKGLLKHDKSRFESHLL